MSERIVSDETVQITAVAIAAVIAICFMSQCAAKNWAESSRVEIEAIKRGAVKSERGQYVPVLLPESAQ